MSLKPSKHPLKAIALLKPPPPSYLCPLLHFPQHHHHQQLHSLSAAQPPQQQQHLHTTPHPLDSHSYTPQQPRQPQALPRWAQTPPQMTAPFRSKPAVEENEYAVNADPVKLDRVYRNVLGSEEGADLLTEEVKWLAVTHKSFDHGRRGYNERLAFLGRKIIELQASLALIQNAAMQGTPQRAGAEEESESLKGLGGLTAHFRQMTMDKQRAAQLGRRYGLDEVVRWKPQRVTDLTASGFPIVIQQALYAIVGAVALQRGGQVANGVVRERILSPLGLRQEAARF